MWRERGTGEWGEKGKGGEDRVGARRQDQERAEGASSPFYSESGIPGCCQVTVGQSLEEMLTFLHFGLIKKGETRKRR